MTDLVERAGKTVIHHGRFSDRIYLMKSDFSDLDMILALFDRLVKENNYSKIFIKVPGKHEKFFSSKGFAPEAVIKGFYGNDSCCFMAKYINAERAHVSENDAAEISNVLSAARLKSGDSAARNAAVKNETVVLSEENAEDLARLYASVFESYPFPIYEPDYILRTMQENSLYFGVFNEGKLVAASSAEMDKESGSAEMTDFATDTGFRGKKTALSLLHSMETEMKKRGIDRLYTIARSFSYGMNITFSRSGYSFAGTLVNNTQICGRIESMNVWYKLL